ncbi:MAG: SRPBCC domain-containing protein [Trebonia sp.]
MTEGTLDTSGPKPAVRLERRLPDPPEVVWRAITDREELKAWFPCDVIVEGGRWEVGAKIAFPFPPEVIDMTLAGQVLAVEEPRLLSYTWGDQETLRFELYPDGDGTRLVLSDELEPGSAARNAAGWEDCLDRLAGQPPRHDAWQERFAAYSAAFTPEIGPQEGPPAGYKG